MRGVTRGIRDGSDLVPGVRYVSSPSTVTQSHTLLSAVFSMCNLYIMFVVSSSRV